MSRIIKYRVWDKRINKYLSNPADIHPFGRETEDGEHVIQFWTNLVDKNGKEIHEGDIVKSDVDWHKNCVGCVVFDIGSFSIRYHNIDGNLTHDCGGEWVIFPLCILYTRIEIIGNIFENPELLK